MPRKENSTRGLPSTERKRLAEPAGESFTPPWYKWGPYVSERAWGTVREDYSANGDAWSYFPFDQAIYKAYRWGEDAIAGWCDRYQLLVFAPVFWNGKDPIIKERLFGLSSSEGNHGEDVKENYYHIDGTPSHSYMKYLYKYPQQAFPYEKLKEENRKRTPLDTEYELVDTGIFDDGRYFDIFIEYAKVSSEDTIIKIEAINRYHQPAPLHILPQLWFRNRWSWSGCEVNKPEITTGPCDHGVISFLASDEGVDPLSNLPFEYRLNKRYLYAKEGAEFLFTDNETRPSSDHQSNGYKEAFNDHLVHGKKTTHLKKGTKAAFHYFYPHIEKGQSVVIYLRLTDKVIEDPFLDIEQHIQNRKKEADEFYHTIHPEDATEEEKKIQRHALADLCWSKQIYLYDVSLWLDGDNKNLPPPNSRYHIRNVHWRHLNSMRILSMPDKWEYPWFAAWDQAFHSVSWALIDIEFAKDQLWLLLFDQFQHPNGQIPAYEWEFSDMNPPIQAWACLKIFQMEYEQFKKKDFVFLEKCLHKLLMNFSWWVNKVDSEGNNVFEGGFLGLDNITVLDRSMKLPSGIKLQQSDGTGWMAFFCLNLMRISMELSSENKVYESLATKFFEHYVYIAHAMRRRGERDYELWSEKDGFFYDVLTYPDGNFSKFRVRSLVGIIPLYAVDYISEEELKKYPNFYENFHWFVKNRPDLVEKCVITQKKDNDKYFVLTPMNKDQLKSVLHYIWNPDEFRSEYGLRSLSKYHDEHPFEFEGKRVYYEPAESSEKIKGGNSNWRGPIWMPTTYLLIESLYKLSLAFEDDIHIKVKNEKSVTLQDMAVSFSERVLTLFKINEDDKRPYLGPFFPYAKDPHFRDHLQFHEYFHSDQGKGLGASHQCGWTALVANIIDELREKF
jgi:hypothetical protein